MKRLLLLVAAAGGAAWWWRNRSGGDSSETWSESTATPVATPQLGGDVDPELLAILACPLDKSPVTRQGNYLVCGQCQRHYPIRDGIPVMLVDEALTPDQAGAGA